MVAALDRIPPDMPPQDVRRELTFAVVGAGASGCELSTKMADLLSTHSSDVRLQGEPRVLRDRDGRQSRAGNGRSDPRVC